MPRTIHPAHIFEGLRAGRPPAAIRPTYPYRLEEWGKGKVYYLPNGKEGPRIAKRGPPACGTIACYFGDETKLPPRDDFEVVIDGKREKVKTRVVVEDFAYSKEDASLRADAYMRRRLMEQIGRARRRARMANRLPVAGAPEAECASASRATCS